MRVKGFDRIRVEIYASVSVFNGVLRIFIRGCE